MMMNERLIGMVPESRKYVAACVAIQWGNLLVNIAAMTAVARTLAALYAQTLTAQDAGLTALVLAFALLARGGCAAGLRAADSCRHCAGADVGEKAAFPLLGQVYRAGRHLP